MHSVKVTGIRFDWGRLKRLPIWAFESWPVLVPLLLGALHVCAVRSSLMDPDSVKLMNRWVSAGLQILGVGFILYSVDANLREFRLASLKDRFAAYFKRFPLLVLMHDLSINSSTSLTHSSSAPLRREFPTDTVAGRLEQLEADIRWLDERIALQDQDLRRRIEGASAMLGERIDAITTSARALEETIKKQTRDGVPSQIFGALLVVYSSIAGVFT